MYSFPYSHSPHFLHFAGPRSQSAARNDRMANVLGLNLRSIPAMALILSLALMVGSLRGFLAWNIIVPSIALIICYLCYVPHGNSCLKSKPTISRNDSFMNTGVPCWSHSSTNGMIQSRFGITLFFRLPVSAPMITHLA